MKKPYADSTLKRKYRNVGIDPKGIQILMFYLTACGRFYKIIKIEEAWKVIGQECKQFGNVSKAEFDALIPIFQRDGRLSFYLERESEFYVDGVEDLLLIDKDYLLVMNEAFSESDKEEYVRCRDKNETYHGPVPIKEDWNRFYALDQHQQGKELYIADDIIRYVDPEYVAETPQVEAMRRFLITEVELEMPSDILEEARSWSTKKKETELTALREEAANVTIQEMHRLICDISVTVSEAFSLVLRCMEDFKYKICGLDQVNRLMKLYTEMSNNTRMPGNRGFTPLEMMQKINY